jgi:hypothetical protein
MWCFFLEIVAGTVSMGLGGYLAGLSEIEHYDAERKRELYEIATVPEREEEEIFEIFEVRSLPMTSFPSFFSVINVFIYTYSPTVSIEVASNRSSHS